MELEKQIKKMLIEEPFYGFMLTTLDRRFTDEVPTMAVAFTSKLNAELLINKEFYESLTDTEQAAVIKHELMHLAFHHLTMGKNFPDARTFNEAADMEVNCYIKGLPDTALFPSQIGEADRLGTVHYYRKLKELKDKQKNGGGGAGGPGAGGFSTLDDHSVWEKVGEDMKVTGEVVNSIIDDILSKTAQAMKSRGCIPAELDETIAKLESRFKQVYDWKKAFRRFLGNSYSERKKRSRRKESRRFPGAAGSKHLKRSNILVAIDTSGSVSERELQEFISELNYMYKAGSRIHVLECDAAIHRDYEYKPGCIDKVSGRGGTDFRPVIDYYCKHYGSYETLVYFTDGEAPIDFHVPQNNMLWLISSCGSHKDYPGKTIYIPRQEEL